MLKYIRFSLIGLAAFSSLLVSVETRAKVVIKDALPHGATIHGSDVTDNNGEWPWDQYDTLNDARVHAGWIIGDQDIGQHYLLGLNYQAKENDTLTTHLLTPSYCSVQGTQFQLNVNGNWAHRVHWGSSPIYSPSNQAAVDRTPDSMTFEWRKLTIALSDFGVQPGETINGIAFTRRGCTIEYADTRIGGNTGKDLLPLQFQSAKQISNYGASGYASRAIDGNTDGNYFNGSVTHTNHTGGNWWQGDLGQSQLISAIKIYPRTDCCQDRLQKFDIYILDNDLGVENQYINISQVRDQAKARFTRVLQVPNAGMTWELDEPVDGRYVVIHKFGNNYLSLAEVEAYTSSFAEYSAALGAPECPDFTSRCDSGAMLNSRGPNLSPPEPNQPNTLDSCTDGSSGTYHSDESIDRITVTSLDGSDLREGATAEIHAHMYAYDSSNYLDFYYAADANSPSWTYISSIQMPSSGHQTHSVLYTLPEGHRQAVRVSLRYGGSIPEVCPNGGYEEADDLAFAVHDGDAYQVGHGVGRVLADLCGATDPHECDAMPAIKYLPVTVRSMDTSAQFTHWYNYLTGPKYLHNDFKCTTTDGTEQNCLNADDTVVEQFLTDTIAVAGEAWDPEEHYALVECNGGLCGNEQVVLRGPSYQGLAGVTRAKTYLTRNNCILKASRHHMNLWDRAVCAIDPLHRRDNLDDMLPIVMLPTTPEGSQNDVYAVFSCARGVDLNEVKASVLDENAALPTMNSNFDCGLDEATMNYLASHMQSLGSAWEQLAVNALYMAGQGLAFELLTGGVGYIFAAGAEMAGTTAEGVKLARQVGVTFARTTINGYFLVSAARAIPDCNGDRDCETLGMIQLAMSLASMGHVAADFEAGKVAAGDYLRAKNPDIDLMTPLLQGMEDGYTENGGAGELFPEGSEYAPEGPTAGAPRGCP